MFKMFNDLWTIRKHKTRFVDAGKSIKLTYAAPGFTYNPATADTHNLAYQKKFGGFQFMVRIEGITAHDTSDGSITNNRASADGIYERTLRCTYDAGVSLDDVSVNDTSSTAFANGAVVSSKPVSDNISYSVI